MKDCPAALACPYHCLKEVGDGQEEEDVVNDAQIEREYHCVNLHSFRLSYYINCHKDYKYADKVFNEECVRQRRNKEPFEFYSRCTASGIISPMSVSILYHFSERSYDDPIDHIVMLKEKQRFIIGQS